MNLPNMEDTKAYMVIKNHKAEYWLWLANRKVPFGWRDAYKRGTREECLTYIARIKFTSFKLERLGSKASELFDQSLEHDAENLGFSLLESIS